MDGSDKEEFNQMLREIEANSYEINNTPEYVQWADIDIGWDEYGAGCDGVGDGM